MSERRRVMLVTADKDKVRSNERISLEAELQPCPFCKQESPHLIIVGQMYEVMLYHVKCLGCLTCGPAAANDTPVKAAKAWNDRETPAPKSGYRKEKLNLDGWGF